MILSPKKHKIITLLARGYTDKEIAQNMDISTRTVQSHISSIISTLNARNRTNAVALYMRSHPKWRII